MFVPEYCKLDDPPGFSRARVIVIEETLKKLIKQIKNMLN